MPSSTVSPNAMVRVSKSDPCPVCGRGDWCLVAVDRSAAICQRVSEGSAKRCGDAGWLHILEQRPCRPLRPLRTHLMASRTKSRENWAEIGRAFECQLTADLLAALSASLGVSKASLQRLGVGFDGSAFTFPMQDDMGNVIGIRRRFPDGNKVCMTGSQNGLFVPTGLVGQGRKLVCEGPSDTAAALDLGFEAVGRPNCNSLVEMTCRYCKGQDVVIIADADGPGVRGAEILARSLVLYCPSVRVIVPPDGIKDLRAWLLAGLTREPLLQSDAPCLTVKLRRASWKQA